MGDVVSRQASCRGEGFGRGSARPPPAWGAGKCSPRLSPTRLLGETRGSARAEEPQRSRISSKKQDSVIVNRKEETAAACFYSRDPDAKLQPPAILAPSVTHNPSRQLLL